MRLFCVVCPEFPKAQSHQASAYATGVGQPVRKIPVPPAGGRLRDFDAHAVDQKTHSDAGEMPGIRQKTQQAEKQKAGGVLGLVPDIQRLGRKVFDRGDRQNSDRERREPERRHPKPARTPVRPTGVSEMGWVGRGRHR